MPHYLDVIDSTFRDDLRQGWENERLVAAWLNWKFNVSVWMADLVIRNNPSQRKKFRDHGDLVVIAPGSYLNGIVGVKQRLNRKFNGVKDYVRNHYPDFILDLDYLFDEACEQGRRPICYIITNPDQTGCIAIDVAKTVHLWTREKKRARGRWRTFYLCPLVDDNMDVIDGIRYYSIRKQDLDLDSVQIVSRDDLDEILAKAQGCLN